MNHYYSLIYCHYPPEAIYQTPNQKIEIASEAQ
ncbi:hypothetical protein cce_2182 [Crocosphaera subtropica ATCC 51142]|uniref:Uncharacterized protein n=1 Tax=Crocosphaera subtropica (strain ATCC 51142 / BH68) TaxID=43989 RepID=B1WNV3_CROS5|nr:hypothetical protein cce_2182 [Crocosphaera subtropica ATCC 51142]